MPVGDKYQRVRRLQQHDASGVETERIEWDEFNDLYGNNTCTGDLSVQRMVERGGRLPWYTTSGTDDEFATAETPQPLDTEPWQSMAQARAMHARAGQPGAMTKAQVAEFDKVTDFKSLPKKKAT